jgi:hypothetical protein
MDNLVGTRSCPHLGFDLKDGRPCCHADDATRVTCGRSAPNPAAQKSGALNISGVEAHFCTVLGTDALPPEALRLAAQEKLRARQQAQGPKYRAPSDVSGQLDAHPSREQEPGDADPIIPTHTVRAEGKQVGPNAPCPCGSGKKFKKCCGRYG